MALEMTPQRLNDEIARLCKGLIAQLFVLFKTSLHYSEGHAAIDSPVGKVLTMVREILRRNEAASLRIKGGHFYLGELRLKLDSAGFEAGRFVMEEMKRHHVGGISFGLGVTPADLRRFVYAFREVDSVPTPDAYVKILERMQQRMVANIEVETLPEEVETVEIDKEKLKDGKLKARLLYQKGVRAMDAVMKNASTGQPLRLRESKRVVQHMIDLLPSNEASLLGMTTIPCDDVFRQKHAANVCILSLVMGRRLGLSKYHLCELGMAALFHDLGKAAIPREILGKGDPLSAEERLTLEMHPVYGVKLIMKSKGVDAMSARIITGVFEHHLLSDFSGYPRFSYQELSLFGRIISVADCYDGLTSPRLSDRKAYPPGDALRFMLTQGGKAYDRCLLKLFINCIGMYGIGSLLLLDSKELAVVVEHNPDPAHWDSPRVRIIADADGREAEGEVVDLAHDVPPRMIVATLNPHLYKLDVSRYFL